MPFSGFNPNYRSADYDDQSAYSDVVTTASDHNGIQNGIRMWDAVIQPYDQADGGGFKTWMRTRASYPGEVGVELAHGVYDIAVDYLADVRFDDSGTPAGAVYSICPWLAVTGAPDDWRGHPNILGSPMTSLIAPGGATTTGVTMPYGFTKEWTRVDLRGYSGTWLVISGVTIWTHAVGFAPTMTLRQGNNGWRIRRYPDTADGEGLTSVSEIRRGTHRFGRARRS